MEIQQIRSHDPKDHVRNLVEYFHALKDHCRADIGQIDDAVAISLLETAAEVLGGLEKAFNDYEDREEVRQGEQRLPLR